MNGNDPLYPMAFPDHDMHVVYDGDIEHIMPRNQIPDSPEMRELIRASKKARDEAAARRWAEYVARDNET
jgi:hypothetical protein